MNKITVIGHMEHPQKRHSHGFSPVSSFTSTGAALIELAGQLGVSAGAKNGQVRVLGLISARSSWLRENGVVVVQGRRCCAGRKQSQPVARPHLPERQSTRTCSCDAHPGKYPPGSQSRKNSPTAFVSHQLAKKFLVGIVSGDASGHHDARSPRLGQQSDAPARQRPRRC